MVSVWSGEIVVGQADFYSPPDQLSCKVWETFVSSVSGGGWGCLENYVFRIIHRLVSQGLGNDEKR